MSGQIVEASVDIKPLKQWAAANLPAGHVLLSLLLAEPDIMSAAEFTNKMAAWRKLVR